MVQLDAQLLADARSIIDGANVHIMKQMVFVYEQAVDLHNSKWPGHEIYHIECEARLRTYVRSRQDEAIQRRILAANKRADEASLKSRALADASDRLGERIEEWTQTVDVRERVA